jgi:hypothetical protein
VRVCGWVGDANVNDPLHACFHGGIYQHFRIFHGLGLGVAAFVEPHPVGVDQNIRTAQVLFQFGGVFKIQREGFDFSCKRVRAVGVIGQCDDFLAACEQPFGDVLARITNAPVTAIFILPPLLSFSAQPVRRTIRYIRCRSVRAESPLGFR